MTEYLLVIVIVNYNGLNDTQSCLESIKETSEGELPFVIIIDNGSRNNHQLEALKESYSCLQIIYNSENVGFGRANNIGINWAKKNLNFEHILLLNNDTILEKNALRYLIEAFQFDQKIGITTSKTMYESNRGIVWYGGGQINYERGRPKIDDYNSLATISGADMSKYVTFVSGCVMMFSKKCIEDVKGFDEDFFMYCEDLEISMRVTQLGYKLYYTPKSVVYHKVQGATRTSESEPTGLKPGNSNSPFLFYHMKSNQWIACKKHMTIKRFAVFNFFFWGEFFYKLFLYVIHGDWKMLKIGFITSKRIFAYYWDNRKARFKNKKMSK